MGSQTVSGAALQCTFGAAPGTLNVLPANQVMSTAPAATSLDNVPAMNVAPFGMCQSPSNPAVVAATAAKLGVFTPVPCLPVLVAPWLPASTKVFIKGKPALTNESKCTCAWGGLVSINVAGQGKTQTT